MIVPFITFIRPIPILGGSLRQDQFSAADGWVIDVHDYGVTISRPANPEQNIIETPAFCTCGVGYSVPAPEVKPVPLTIVDESLSDEAKTRIAAGDVEAIASVNNGQGLLSPVAPVVTVEAQATLPTTSRKGKQR